jgi:CubicO group peptidase (beta-lactamase class C family)
VLAAATLARVTHAEFARSGRLRGPAGRATDPLGRREFLGLAAAAGLTLPFVPHRHRITPPAMGTGSTVDTATPLDAYVRDRMAAARVPGLAATVVSGGRIIWSAGYGWANLERRMPATPDTDFMLASISKTVMATAAMQAVERGLLDLDADINDVLPFSVRNPNHPADPISLRQLLTHTSSLRDNWRIFDRFYAKGDSDTPLGGYLRRWFTPGSDLYDARKNFDRWAPGARYEYSNIGASMAGFLVEAASGMPFDRWCERHIFGPLQMPQTSWHLKGLDRSNVAMPYRAVAGGYRPYGQYGYPDYPDGALRTTARELAHHLLSFMRFGTFRGARVLQHDTVQEMRRPQIPGLARGQGLIWYRAHIGGHTVLAHNGGDSGVATQMYFRPDDGVGVIVLTNGDWHQHHGIYPLQQIVKRLFMESASLAQSR